MAAGDHRGVRGGLHADRAKAVVRILLGVLGPPRSGRRADAQAQGRALRLRGSAWVTHPHVAVAPHQLAGHELCVEDPRALPHLEPAAAKCGNRQARRTVAWNEDPIPDPTDNVGRIVPMHPTSVNIVQGCARCFPSVVAAWLIWSRAVTTSAHMPLPASGRVLAKKAIGGQSFGHGWACGAPLLWSTDPALLPGRVGGLVRGLVAGVLRGLLRRLVGGLRLGLSCGLVSWLATCAVGALLERLLCGPERELHDGLRLWSSAVEPRRGPPACATSGQLCAHGQSLPQRAPSGQLSACAADGGQTARGQGSSPAAISDVAGLACQAEWNVSSCPVPGHCGGACHRVLASAIDGQVAGGAGQAAVACVPCSAVPRPGSGGCIACSPARGEWGARSRGGQA
eukprot:CAMPEP_0175526710 /NCGR_PEP_ID=MMETSP0096-20121207/19756_1 /TAXON_ID=311494 /ORGANISM="Alexandrium monilatum, Strain CCMP3105" /LENGTH=397 /DNA_ID=CAMNT_0016829349 /DNA_START=229 /DNA_END=1419 /DNA_ORIENTATION=-